MPAVLSEKKPGEKVHIFGAITTGLNLYPQEVLDVSFVGAALQAFRPVKMPDLRFKLGAQIRGGCLISIEVKMLNFLFDNPVSHRIYVESCHITAHPVSLYKWSPPTHERIENAHSLEFIGPIECLAQRTIYEFGKDQCPEKSSRAACEPFVYCNDGAIILLDLFFP